MRAVWSDGAWYGVVMGSDACGLCLHSSEMHCHFPWAVRIFAASRNRIVVCEDRTRSLIFDRWSQKVRRTVSNRPCHRFDSGATSSLVTVGLRSLSLYVVILAWRTIGRSRKHLSVIRRSCLVTVRESSLLVIEGILEYQYHETWPMNEPLKTTDKPFISIAVLRIGVVQN